MECTLKECILCLNTGRHLRRVMDQEKEIVEFRNDVKVLVERMCKVGQ